MSSKSNHVKYLCTAKAHRSQTHGRTARQAETLFAIYPCLLSRIVRVCHLVLFVGAYFFLVRPRKTCPNSEDRPTGTTTVTTHETFVLLRLPILFEVTMAFP